jgi:hypothetical protein
LHKDIDIAIAKIGEIPRAGDIWILQCARSPDHFTHFFIPRIENLFQIGDKILTTKAIEVTQLDFS